MYGLLGKKLGHSFSKLIHEQFTDKEYQLIETDNLNQFFSENVISGMNVTIPYKKDVIPYLDELSTEAAEIGVVNTIISKNKKLIGYNTDYYGLKKTLDYYQISVSNQTVLILGNGSTSDTIKHYCVNNNAKEIIVFARSPRNNEYLFSETKNFKHATIIFNATPVGMFPNNQSDLLVDLNNFPNLSSVIDVIYNPLKTKLLIEAEQKNVKSVNGLLMLIYQAIKSIELFHNLIISDAEVINYYKHLLFEKTNLVFIGMPMSGKSLFTSLASQKYHKELVEIDTEIERYENDSISNIFQTKGEKHFRNVEKDIILKYSKLNNKAISCGGGVVLNEENMVNLKQNGIIIFIDVPLELLKKCNPRNRPLLQNKENLENIYNQRIQLYRDFQDITITKSSFDKKSIMNQIEVKINEYISTKWT